MRLKNKPSNSNDKDFFQTKFLYQGWYKLSLFWNNLTQFFNPLSNPQDRGPNQNHFILSSNTLGKIRNGTFFSKRIHLINIIISLTQIIWDFFLENLCWNSIKWCFGNFNWYTTTQLLYAAFRHFKPKGQNSNNYIQYVY